MRGDRKVIGYLDCTSGISGDKFLAALVGAGASREAVNGAVRSLDDSIRIDFETVNRGGVAALSVRVAAGTRPHLRTWRDIRELLESAGLTETVASRALATFELLAAVEAEVHGTTPDEVHFHEVGAIDSIADVVGACAAFEDLGLSSLVCGPVALGSGTVRTAHGTLPVPAPATALLVTGIPVETGAATGEATTPTGAALVRTCVTSFGPMPSMVPSAIGHGAGSREMPGMPNVARLIVGEPVGQIVAGDTERLAEEPVVELVTAIDHLGAEHIADAVDRLFDAGALDVWQTPVTMKKGRLGAEVTVLCAPGAERDLAALLADLTGTLGIRIRRLSRYVAARRELTLATSLGQVRFKVAGTGDAARIRAEYDDVAQIARREKAPADRIARILEAEAASQFDSDGRVR